jgi:hypothetical protein
MGIPLSHHRKVGRWTISNQKAVALPNLFAGEIVIQSFSGPLFVFGSFKKWRQQRISFCEGLANALAPREQSEVEKLLVLFSNPRTSDTKGLFAVIGEQPRHSLKKHQFLFVGHGWRHFAQDGFRCVPEFHSVNLR